MAAKEELLGALHEAVAQDLLRRLNSGEATASDVSNAIKFLKDNGIEAIMAENSPLHDLVKDMPSFGFEGGLYDRSN